MTLRDRTVDNYHRETAWHIRQCVDGSRLWSAYW